MGSKKPRNRLDTPVVHRTSQATWVPFKLDMPPNHGFTALPGHKLMVMSRGAVQFDYPEDWIVTPTDYSIKFVDRPYPNNDLILEVTRFVMPGPEVSVQFMENQLHEIFTADTEEIFDVSAVSIIQKPHWKGAWGQACYIDHENNRPAVRRHLIACNNFVLVFLTFCFWLEDTLLRDVNWKTLTDTLRIGELILDPRKHIKQ